MKKVTLEQARNSFDTLVKEVSDMKESVEITLPGGEQVRLVPIPQPIGTWKGRPIYKADDAQHLDKPYFFD
ncbi:MAG TPA: type II toxin-antitoxin system Phd/YefM family antitoxin [Planctomycetota bacterium]|nr:type II toxin-antitoxin system Phd/YefM family antitoxin [Planctomycetota bacterium]